MPADDDASPGGVDALPPRAGTVSVVIPVKDDGAALERCLRALGYQTRPPDEVIVVDNGSSDTSADVARRGGAVVVSCATPGIPAASAAGYDRASGDLILRLDADCIPDPRWVEACTNVFRDRPELVACTGGARFTDGPRLLRRPLAAAYLTAYVLATTPALGHRPLFGSNLAMRSDAWRTVRTRVHRHDAEIHDDLDLAFHLGACGRIGSLPSATMGMSMRPFRSAHGFLRRVRRGTRTVTLHWPVDFPPFRWARIAAVRRGRSPRPGWRVGVRAS
ncbi:glycosyltransferase family 2 protein [Microbacterium caowuchunii]|uniref:glycosyltransferase family A protein n=1 Tax=Microbacterium caowuchunii TaxID=2614638 RepID=UPI001245C2AE|nr:glycosyltransferase family A protein [Microbacterium caowuchunii]QEW00533.1 glycosyltransferase family 2 protein [Microbacterium caowuchunii]